MFCEATGIKLSRSLYVKDLRLNQACSLDLAEAARRVYVAHRAYTRAQMVALLREVRRITDEIPRISGQTPFTPAEARSFAAGFDEGNARICTRYLGGRALFPDDFAYPVWEPDEETIGRFYRRLVESAALEPHPMPTSDD